MLGKILRISAVIFILCAVPAGTACSRGPAPYEAGSVTVVSNGEVYQPYKHMRYSKEGELFSDGTPLRLEAIADSLPEIVYDDGYKVVMTGNDLLSYKQYLYDETFNILEHSEKITVPAVPVIYYLCIEADWGNGDENPKNEAYIGYTYVFKLAVYGASSSSAEQ